VARAASSVNARLSGASSTSAPTSSVNAREPPVLHHRVPDASSPHVGIAEQLSRTRDVGRVLPRTLERGHRAGCVAELEVARSEE
jgi:hypothetical protein